MIFILFQIQEQYALYRLFWLLDKNSWQMCIDDGYNSIGTILSKAGKVTIISRCFYGCYSPFVKNILDGVFAGCFRFLKIYL